MCQRKVLYTQQQPVGVEVKYRWVNEYTSCWGVAGWMLMVNMCVETTGWYSPIVQGTAKCELLNHNSNIRSVLAHILELYAYISIKAQYTYVHKSYVHGWHGGENVRGTQCLLAQMFYCILKQPSEPTVSYTRNCRTNTSYDDFMNGKTHYPI